MTPPDITSIALAPVFYWMTFASARSLTVVALRPFIVYLLASVVLTGCMPISAIDSDLAAENSAVNLATATAASVCPVSKPAWVKPPDDPAVQGSPADGYYFVNQDRLIWASAWWTGREEDYLRVSEDGIKVGWYRPAGAALVITGQRVDGQAAPLGAHVPCCYPTRFQASGLFFPTAGCWEVTAKAADSKLVFVVSVEP